MLSILVFSSDVKTDFLIVFLSLLAARCQFSNKKGNFLYEKICQTMIMGIFIWYFLQKFT